MMAARTPLRAVPAFQARAMSTGFNKTQFREPDPSKPKLVLAYSGGLDTSTQLNWLAKQKGFEVCAYIANLGQDDVKEQSQIDDICKKAEQSGAYAFYCEDMREEFVQDYVYPCIKANALYEGRYLMGTSMARPAIGKKQMDVVKNEGAKFVSHGSTGKGNDQVRFELCYLGIDPKIKCVTLWRDPEYLAKFKGRQDLIDHAEANGIPVTATKKHSYSEDENAFHISFESGELEDPAYPGNEQPYPGLVLQKKSVNVEQAPDKPTSLTIEFEKGIPTKVIDKTAGKTITGDWPMFDYLNKVGGENAIGSIDIVENRFVGLKSRGCYETPGGTILFAAHQDLELLVMDREVMRIRDPLSLKFAELCYNGFWFSPEMDFLMHSLDHTQQVVTGSVDLVLYKGNVMPRGRSSPFSLYDEKMVSMDEEGGFDATHSTGFIETLSTRLKANMARDRKAGTK